MAKRRAIPGNLPQTGGGGGSLQPGDVGTTEIANGAVTKVKLSATGGTGNQLLALNAAGDTLIWENKGALPDGSVAPVKLADITTGASAANKLIALSSAGTAFALADPFTISDGDITAAKLNVTTGLDNAGKLIALDETNGTALALRDYPTFSLSAGDIDNSNLFAAGVVDANAIGADQVGLSELNIDGTAAAGKVAKVYDDGGTLKLQWADDNNSGGGGGGNVTLPLDLASSTNFSGLNPVARGGTGASTAAAARLNLGAAAAGSVESDDGSLPYITDANATPDNHQGRYDDSTANRPDTGSTGGVIWEIEDNQVALETEGSNSGALWVRTKTETNDTAWTSPANANATQITTIAAWRGLGFDTVRESTLASAHPQQTSVDCAVTKIRGGFAGTGYFILIVSGSTNPPAWWAEVPSGNSWTGSDLVWTEWGNAPNYDVDSDVYQDYRKIPAGRVGLVPSLNISSTIQRDALVAHGFASNSSTFTAYSYSGGNLQSSTIGRTVTAGSWAKAQIGNDQLEDGSVDADTISDDLVITESDGTAVSRMKVPQLEDVELTGYTLVTTSNPAAGQVGFDTATRTVVVRAASGDETLLDEIVARDFEFSIQKTSSGQAASVRGVFSADPIELSGLLRGVLRADDLQSNGTLAAGDTVKVTGHKAVYTKLDAIPPIGLGIGHGSSQANHLVKMNASGSAFTAGSLESENLPTLLADIRDISEHLTIEQMIRGRAFGTSYQYGATIASLVAGRFNYNDTTRELVIYPLAADGDLAPYLLPDVYFDITSTNGAKISGEIEAVVSVSNQPTGSFAVRFRDHHSLYSGDIRSGTVSVSSRGAFVKRGDDVERITDGVIDRANLNTTNTGSAGQVLTYSATGSGLSWTAKGSGGGTPVGDTFTAAEFSSKVFGATSNTQYARVAAVGSLEKGNYLWDDTNKRVTFRPRDADTDLTTRTPVGARLELRGASGLRVDGIIASRPSNPANAPAGSFTIQFDSNAQTYYQSSGFAASTANMVVYCHGKVASWDAMNSTVSGLFGSIDREMIDTTNNPSNGQVLGVGTTLDTNDRRLVWVDYTAPRAAQILANHQTANGGSITTNSFTDAASLLALPSFEIVNLNDMLDFAFTGVLYFNAGAIGSIGIEARLQYRYATTAAGLSTASWSTASIDLTGGLNDAELIFRSKIAAGGSGDGSFRDYMPTITAWGSVDSLTTGPAVGNHIEFRIQFRMPSNSGFNTVNSYYSWRQRVMICPAAS